MSFKTTWQEAALPLGALALVIAAVFWPVWLGRFYAVGDMRDVFIPLESFFHTEVLQHRIPAWNPDVAWGFPVIAAAQIGFFYPPLLVSRFLPPLIYLPLNLVGHFIFMAVGMFCFLRALGRGRSAALLGALAFAVSGFAIQHITHFNIILAIAWLPWQFLAAERIHRQLPRLRLTTIVYFVAVLTVPFLAGQLQVPAMMAMVTSLYLLTQLKTQSVSWLKSLALLGLVALLALALASVQLLPTWELAQFSSRGPGGDFTLETANQHSFPLYHLPTILFPRFFGSDSTYWGKRLEIEYGFYIGSLPLFLALWSMRTQGRQLKLWLILAILAFLLSLGNLSPFRILGFEPSLWFFSAPARWLLFFTFALSVLSAYGYDHLQSQSQQFRRFLGTCLAAILGGVLIAQLIIIFLPDFAPAMFAKLQASYPDFFSGRPTAYYLEKIGQLQGSLEHSSVSLRSPFTWLPLCSLGAAYFFLRYRPSKHIIVIVTIAELLMVAATTVPTIPWKSILAPPATVQQLPAHVRDGRARILTIYEGGDTGAVLTNPGSRPTATDRELQRQLLVPLLNAQYGIPGTAWPASLDLKTQATAREALAAGGLTGLNISLLQDLNIGAVVTMNKDRPAEGLRLEEPAAVIKIYSVTPGPRASLQGIDGGPLKGDNLQYTPLTPRHIRIAFTAPSNSVVRIANTWYPGWQAYVDGERATLQQLPPFFLGVPVPQGEHQLDLIFRPLSLQRGLYTSLLSLIGLLVVTLCAHRAKLVVRLQA